MEENKVKVLLVGGEGHGRSIDDYEGSQTFNAARNFNDQGYDGGGPLLTINGEKVKIAFWRGLSPEQRESALLDLQL